MLFDGHPCRHERHEAAHLVRKFESIFITPNEFVAPLTQPRHAVVGRVPFEWAEGLLIELVKLANQIFTRQIDNRS